LNQSCVRPKRLFLVFVATASVGLSRCSQETGWAGKQNGELLHLAETSFDVLVTLDTNLRNQQNLSGRAISIEVLQSSHWLDHLRQFLLARLSAIKKINPAPRLAVLDHLCGVATPVDGQKRCGRLCFFPVDHLKECMPPSKSEVLQGTLDLLVLKTLDSMGPIHGFGIALRIQQISEDLLQLNQGTLYPALLRLEQRGWIASKWGVSENNRRAKYYSLTRTGRKQLEEEAESWGRMSAMINRVLKTG
jgi:PadR family transcriptional regulator, regulatory protein PadR